MLITADRSLECVSEKTKGSGCGTEAQIDENTLTHTQHSQKHIDNAYAVVWGHAWQSLNKFNEPYLVRIGKRSPHRAAFIKQTSPRQIFKTDSLAVFRGASLSTSKSASKVQRTSTGPMHMDGNCTVNAGLCTEFCTNDSFGTLYIGSATQKSDRELDSQLILAYPLLITVLKFSDFFFFLH